MFLSSHEIAQNRENALNNLLCLALAGVDAGQRFSELISANSREAILHGSRHWLHLGHGQLETVVQFPATVWLDSAARASRMHDDVLKIISETAKTMLRRAEDSLRGISTAAVETVAPTEQEAHQASAIVAASKPAPRRRAAVKSSTAST
jgi:hypothetical protein